MALDVARFGLDLAGGANENGTLILHANPQLTYTSDQNDYCGQAGLAACSLAVSTVPYDGTPRVLHVLAAFPDTAQPRLKALSWGVAYDPARVVIAAHGPCGTGEFDIPDNGWPGNGTGIGQSWTATRTSLLNEIYWFAAYAYGAADTTSLRLTPHPLQGGVFVDDSAPPVEDPIAAYGWMGFGRGGNTPCPSVGSSEGGDGGPVPPGGSEGGGEGTADSGCYRGEVTFVELNTATAGDFLRDYIALERDHHLRVLVARTPDALICRADSAQRAALSEDHRVSIATDELIPGIPPMSTGDLMPGDPGFAARAWNESLVTPPPADSGLKVGGGFPGCLIDEEGEERGTPHLHPERQTSVYMMGRVGVSLLFMESDSTGPCGPPGYWEDWTDLELQWANFKIAEGLRGLADMNSDANVTFVIYEDSLLSTSVEPIQLGPSDETWKHEAMDQMGMDPAMYVRDRIFALNNLRRSTPDPESKVFDWWYTVFVVRDVCDTDHKFPDGETISWANRFGPQVTLLYANGGEYPSTWLGHILAHETCHIFGADDEYAGSGCGCSGVHGYLRVPNGNCENCPGPHTTCIMRRNADFTLCDYTQGQIGWRDSDVPPDGILDPIDHPDATHSMFLGEEEAIGLGAPVDIYSGSTWVKRLHASGWTMHAGRMLWDGIRYNGQPASAGDYGWRVDGGTLHTGTLAADTTAPEISNLEIIPGPGTTATLRFDLTDLDTHSGRTRATATTSMPGYAEKRVIPDQFFRDSAGSWPPIEAPIDLPHEGVYTISLRAWDVGGGQYDTEEVTGYCGDPLSTDHPRVLVPSLALSRSRPNPATDWVSWDLERDTPGVVDLRVVTVDGRCVRSWPARSVAAGRTRILWNGLDEAGRRVASGTYYLTARDPAGRTTTKSVTIVH